MSKMTLRLLGAASVSALLFGSGAANAVNTITLTGTVPNVCSLSVNAAAGATDIALQTSQTALAVGSVDETCNDDSGYTVSMVTTHGVTSGMFTTGIGDATRQLNYVVKYAGVVATPIAGFVTVTDVIARVAGSGTVNKAVTISFTAAALTLVKATDYSDTLTFAMTAK